MTTEHPVQTGTDRSERPVDVAAVVAPRGGTLWRCRTCDTRNPPGWRVCRACGAPRPRARRLLPWRAGRTLTTGAISATAVALGIWILNAWTAIVGNGAWLVAGTVGWTLLVAITTAIVWRRNR